LSFLAGEELLGYPMAGPNCAFDVGKRPLTIAVRHAYV
jgi:hypothetical protein